MGDNELSRITIENATSKLQQCKIAAKSAELKRFFDMIASGAEEQIAYFPFNPDNPIYTANGLVPKLKTCFVEASNKISMSGSLFNMSNENMLDVVFVMDVSARTDRFNIHMSSVSNDSAYETNRHKATATYLMNTLQNWLAYSNHPGCLSLSAGEEGKCSWPKWFDFHGHSIWDLDEYRKEFSDVIKSIDARAANRTIVGKLRYPVQFRNVHELLGIDDCNLGRTAMYKCRPWRGICGLKEMRDSHPIRRKGLEMLSERGIKPEHPADFQKVIARKLKEQDR